jgi:hypothetical protein
VAAAARHSEPEEWNDECLAPLACYEPGMVGSVPVTITTAFS